MKSIILSINKYLVIICFLAAYSSTIVQAQTNNVKICEEGDCALSIFSIKMDDSSQPNPPGIYSNERTERFKQAYLSFQKIKNGYAQSTAWKTKYEASQLGGKRCLRHYQLESYFANEYVQNSNFKQFIDSQKSDSNKYIKNGFDSSRKGLNLAKRMRDNCPKKAKEVENKKESSLDNLPKEYMKLGQELGYFDEKGNLLKPLDLPKAPGPEKKMSKKEQVADLKNKVNNLPVGQDMKDKVSGISNDLNKAKERSGKLGNLLKTLAPGIAGLLAPQLPILANLGKIKNVLGGLLSWRPKLPKLGLVDKIKGLFNKGKKLTDKAQQAVGKSKDLGKRFEDLGDKAKKLQNDVEKRIKKVTNLESKLDDLAKNKNELLAKLEDKPKKILDELKKDVGDAMDKAKDITDKVDDELKAKDKLLKDLADLEREKEKIADELGNLEKEAATIAGEAKGLEKEKDEAVTAVDAAKKEAEKVEEMATSLEKLSSDEDLEEALVICEDDLKSLLLQIEPIGKAQKEINSKITGLKDKPKKLFGKIKDLKLFQKGLKKVKDGIPIADKTLKKVDSLMEKATVLGSIAEILTGKKTKLQEQIEGMNDKFNKIQDAYENRVSNLEKMKGDLVTMISEKTNLKQTLADAVGEMKDMEVTVQDFIKRYNIFEDDSKCIGQDQLKEKLEEIEAEQKETEPKLEELEEEIEKAETAEEELEKASEAVEKEIEEEAEKVEELKEEEEAIKEEFGQDIKLEPVTTEEWTESFEVKREYWDAVFHPDDEVVEGFKGRWFQVKLKDASKNVKLLFGPGEYFMNKGSFRDTYGSVIGAFVTEALNGMKKSERGEIKLFVQGSADIAGQNTFRGNLDSKFMYSVVTVLPQKEDSDNFSGTPTDKSIPEKEFTNTDLPNLRGNFLKEMISVYSKKLKPVLLEGAVKEEVDEGDRNAVIYLFIPDSLVEKYED